MGSLEDNGAGGQQAQYKAIGRTMGEHTGANHGSRVRLGAAADESVADRNRASVGPEGRTER